MLYTPGTRKTDVALKMLFVLSSICNCILVLTVTPVQTLSDFLRVVVYVYRNSFLSLMRDTPDVHIRAMLFSYLSCQAVSTAGNYSKCKSRPFLNGRMAFFYCALIKSFHKPFPSPHGLQARCAPTCGTLRS